MIRPFLLVYGEFDTTAPPSQGILLQGLLDAVGVPATYSEYPYGHSFPDEVPELDAELYAFFDQYVKNADSGEHGDPPLVVDSFTSVEIPEDGTTVEVELSGSGFSATDVFEFSPVGEVVLDSSSFLSDTVWRLVLRADSAPEFVDVDLTLARASGAESVQVAAAFRVVPTDPGLSIQSVDPLEIRRGQVVRMTIQGSGFTEATTVAPDAASLGVVYDRNNDSMLVGADGSWLSLDVSVSLFASTSQRGITLSDGADSVTGNGSLRFFPGWYDELDSATTSALAEDQKTVDSDPDLDRLPNLIEVGMGSAVLEPNWATYPLMQRDVLVEGVRYTLSYPKVVEWIRFTIEHSTNMIDWSTEGVSAESLNGYGALRADL